MNERELGKALLDFHDRQFGGADERALARRIIWRDRLQVRLIAAAAIAFWLIATALIFPQIALVRDVWPAFDQTMTALIDATGVQSDLPAELDDAARIAPRALAAAVGLLFGAAALTLWCISASRRATLREINAALAQIARRLDAPPPA